MDGQDAQDYQDGTLQHDKLALAMIVSGFADARGKGTANSKSQILCILSIDVKKTGMDRQDKLPGMSLRRKLAGLMMSRSSGCPAF